MQDNLVATITFVVIDGPGCPGDSGKVFFRDGNRLGGPDGPVIPDLLDLPEVGVGGEPCPWDLNGDGSVGINDLLSLLGQWGTDPGGPPDFDGDGTVGITDLIELLANWGPCP